MALSGISILFYSVIAAALNGEEKLSRLGEWANFLKRSVE